MYTLVFISGHFANGTSPRHLRFQELSFTKILPPPTFPLSVFYMGGIPPSPFHNKHYARQITYVAMNVCSLHYNLYINLYYDIVH